MKHPLATVLFLLFFSPAFSQQPLSQDLTDEVDTTSFFEGSKVIINNPTPARIADLALLGKVWGFLKYYHPAVAAGRFNWDFELFRFLPKYLEANDNRGRDKLLEGWIESLGDLPYCRACKKKTEAGYRLAPDLAWLDDAELSSSLREKLHYVLDRRNQGGSYYIEMFEKIGNPKFKHERPYIQFSYPDEGYRLLAIYRYWNIIQYFFPYRDMIGEDWCKVLEALIPKFLEATDALSYKLAVLELASRINDTHANVWSEDGQINDFYGRLWSVAQIKFIENHAVVTGYYNNKLGETSGLQIGDIITSINGEPVEKVIERLRPFYPASNDAAKMRKIATNLLRGNQAKATLGILREGTPIEVAIDRYDIKSDSLDTSINWAYHLPDSCYRLLSPEVGYICLGNIQSALIPAIFEKFKNTKGIVIDIRNYPAESVVHSLGKYLMPKATAFMQGVYGSVTFPGLFSPRPIRKVGEKNRNYYKGKVVILINEITQSHAEYTAMAFRVAPNATVVGNTTAGADGNVSKFSLPGGVYSVISGVGIFYPDGKPAQRVGIVPDIEVKPTVAGICAGRDELLEKAYEVITGEKRAVRL